MRHVDFVVYITQTSEIASDYMKGCLVANNSIVNYFLMMKREFINKHQQTYMHIHINWQITVSEN